MRLSAKGWNGWRSCQGKEGNADRQSAHGGSCRICRSLPHKRAGSIFGKRAAIRLEESHPLGRLWDIDVFQDSPEAVSRETVGAERRTCLLCGRDAKECARSRRHDIRKLQDKVTEIIAGWQTGNRT